MNAIEKFIEQYKVMAKDHFMKRFEMAVIREKELEKMYLKGWQIGNIISDEFGPLIAKNRYYPKHNFEIKIGQIIEYDAESKKVGLINQVEKKIGKIVDLKGMSVGNDGSLNGLVIGESGKAVVETIYAGGYNIQKLHFRVLVKVIK